MIHCPKCNATLPDWVQTCQFCQGSTLSVARPSAAAGEIRTSPSLVATAKWIWPAYYAVAGYLLISGTAQLIVAIVLMAAPQQNPDLQIAQTFTTVRLIVGAVTAAIGAGLLAKVEFVRGIVNVFCWLQILVSALGLLASLMAGLVLGPAAMLGVIVNVFNIATAALLIYLIGETD